MVAIILCMYLFQIPFFLSDWTASMFFHMKTGGPSICKCACNRWHFYRCEKTGQPPFTSICKQIFSCFCIFVKINGKFWARSHVVVLGSFSWKRQIMNFLLLLLIFLEILEVICWSMDWRIPSYDSLKSTFKS